MSPPSSEFVARLQSTLRSMSPFPADHHAASPSSVPSLLRSCSSVFVRVDAVKRPLVPPYSGPYKVLERGAKVFVILKAGKPWSVSIDRLKPVIERSEPETETDQIVSNNPVEPCSDLAPLSRTYIPDTEQFPELPKPSKNTPPLQSALTTRSGRLVKPPKRFDV